MKKNLVILVAILVGFAQMILTSSVAWAAPTPVVTPEQSPDGGGDPDADPDGGEIPADGTAISGSDICNSNLSAELKEAAGCNTSSSTTLFTIATDLIKVVLGIVGVIAVGVVIYGGFTYATSTGNTSKTAKARNILLYGAVGLVVALLAYAIVSFVSGVLG